MTAATRQNTKRVNRSRRADPTSLYVRGLDSSAVRDVKRRAGARGLTNAQYITALVALHSILLDATQNPQMQDALASCGLGRVET